MGKQEYERLCAELCSLLGVRPPEFRHEDSVTTLVLPFDGLAVILAHAPSASPAMLSATIPLGSLDGDELNGWTALLDANHAFRGPSAPRFARDPAHHGVILQHAFEPPITAAAFLEKIRELLSIAQAWKSRQKHPHAEPKL